MKRAKGTNPLHEAVLAALPGSMKDIGARVGVQGQVLWDVVHTLRKAGVIGRRGPIKAREFFKLERIVLPVSGPDISPGLAAADAEKEQRKARKRPVVLFWIDGWPTQDPNRRMVWKVYHEGKAAAERDLQHLVQTLGHEAGWEMANLSMHEVRRMRARGFDLKEQLERRRTLQEMAEQTRS